MKNGVMPKAKMRAYSLVVLGLGRISSKSFSGKILHYILASAEARVSLDKRVSKSEAACERVVALSSARRKLKAAELRGHTGRPE